MKYIYSIWTFQDDSGCWWVGRGKPRLQRLCIFFHQLQAFIIDGLYLFAEQQVHVQINPTKKPL